MNFPKRRPHAQNADEPLTVVHIFSGDLWAGAEVVIFNLLSHLHEQPGLRVLALSLNEGTLAEKLRAAGIPTYVIPEARYSFAGIVCRAAQLLKRTRIAAIHSHRYKENVLAWLLAKWIGASELLTTIHGLPEPATHSESEARLARWRNQLDYFVVTHGFSGAIAVSEEMKRALVQQHGFRADQVVVIRNGGVVPPPRITPAVPRGERFHIGTVARMVPVKGLDLFLDVAAAVRREAPFVHFSLLGDGPLREELARRVASLNIHDCVEFVAPRPDPTPYYRTLDLYLNTSKHEGIPLSVIEAMACGTPIVSSAVGGIPEIVTHGEHGFLVEAREAGRFAQWCVTLMRDDHLRRMMGERASARARSHFSASAMAHAYRDLYDERSARTSGPVMGPLEGSRSPRRPLHTSSTVPALRKRIIRRLKATGRRFLERLERRRAEALRRNPAPLRRSLRGARSVLILCQGNVIRSVFAAHLLSAALHGRRRVTIRSAGLATEPGWRPHPRVTARCAALDIDLNGQSSVPVTQTMLKAADVVLVMEVPQLIAAIRRFSRVRRRTFLLSSLAPDAPLEIEDPAGKEETAVDACLDHIARALKPVIAIMT